MGISEYLAPSLMISISFIGLLGSFRRKLFLPNWIISVKQYNGKQAIIWGVLWFLMLGPVSIYWLITIVLKRFDQIQAYFIIGISLLICLLIAFLIETMFKRSPYIDDD